MNQNVPLSLGKRYFQIQPLNNISSYEFNSGQDVIKFLIPSQPNTVLDDVVFSCNINLNTGSNTAYIPSNITSNVSTSQEIGCDSVAGAHCFFQKIEVFSRRGNLLLESNQFYDQTAKIKEASYHSGADLNVGIPNVMNIQSSCSSGAMSRLTRANINQNGVPLAFRLDLGMLSDSKQKINLDASGGLEIIIHLSSTKNALFNMNNAFTSKLADGASLSFANVELFGRYMMMNGAAMSSFSTLDFTEVSNNLQILQSSRDVTGFTPMVKELDNLIMVSQPNSDTRNNFASCGQSTNGLVGQKKYKLSKGGMAFPYNWGTIDTVTAAPNVSAAADISKGYNLGNAEPTYHNCTAIQNQYPLNHSCISAMAQYLSELERNRTDKQNYTTRNFQPIAVSYKYGFNDYSTDFSKDLLQIETQSSVKTSDPHTNATIRAQTQTFNNFYKYHSNLNYASLMVSR